jgi:hypothetical protein
MSIKSARQIFFGIVDVVVQTLLALVTLILSLPFADCTDPNAKKLFNLRTVIQPELDIRGVADKSYVFNVKFALVSSRRVSPPSQNVSCWQ